MRRAPLVALAFVALFVAADASAQPSQLAMLPGATTSAANAVNTAGTIVGSMNFADAPFGRAVMWVNGVPSELPRHCPTCNSAASDINDIGDVSGNVTTAEGVTHAAVWRNGVLTVLPSLPDHVGAVALSINDSGVLAGYSTGSDGVLRPVRWIDGAPEDLGQLPGVDMPWGIALAINNAGEIVGAVRPLNGQEERPFAWRNGVMAALEIPPAGACNLSAALANNDSGLIVGYVFVDCRQTAAVWENGVLHILPPLPPIPSFPFPLQGGGSALDVNERGDIVGLGNPAFGPAALWRNGDVINLGALEPQVLPNGAAYDINDAGVAVGFSNTSGGRRAVVWITTPPNTPPFLNLPGEIVVYADSPAGANVSFLATASDNEDGDFAATCSAGSGANFPIGVTTVECHAIDSGGLEASGSFTVIVVGAYEQADELLRELSDMGPGGSLQTKLSALLESLQPLLMLRASGTSASGDGTGKACARVQAFINEVRAQSGKKITAAQAAAFIAAAQRISAVIGC